MCVPSLAGGEVVFIQRIVDGRERDG